VNNTSGKASVSEAGGTDFKSRANQIFHTLSRTRHRCKCPGAKSRRLALDHSWHSKGFKRK